LYCPYCGIDHDDTIVKSIEHVVPYSLGGSDELTIVTCEKSNNDLGSDVDAPFANFFPVQGKRFFLGLESTKGNSPTLDLGGTGWIDGKEVAISYVISGGRKELKIARPQIVKTPTADGNEHRQILGDPAKVREIIAGKLQKQTKLGKTMTREDGSILRLEDLDKLFAENEKITKNPSVLKTIQPDYYLISIRFFSKLALAIGHLHLGETFSRSPIGDLLRRHMNIEKLEETRRHGAIWPETASVKPMIQIIAKEDHHVLAIMDGEPPVLLVSLFGEYDAFIPLGELAPGRYPKASSEGTVWRIELPSRKVTRLAIRDVLVERSEEARRKTLEALGLQA
jgi:ribosomal protein L30/L7E